jgi:hypothetical protein
MPKSIMRLFCSNPSRAPSAQIYPAPLSAQISPTRLSTQIYVPLSAQISAPLLPKHILALIPQGNPIAAPLPAPPRRRSRN